MNTRNTCNSQSAAYDALSFVQESKEIPPESVSAPSEPSVASTALSSTSVVSPKHCRSPLLALALPPAYRPRRLLLLQAGQITVLFLHLYRHFPLLFHRSLNTLFPALSMQPFPRGPLAPHRLLRCRFYINRSWWALVFLLYRQN